MESNPQHGIGANSSDCPAQASSAVDGGVKPFGTAPCNQFRSIRYTAALRQCRTGGEHRMRAAVIEEFGEPLVIRDLAIAAPGPHEVLLRTAAVGLCHSDLHYMQGMRKFPLPGVLGHEVSGIVEAVGARREGPEARRPRRRRVVCLLRHLPAVPRRPLRTVRRHRRQAAARARRSACPATAQPVSQVSTCPASPSRCWCTAMRS